MYDFTYVESKNKKTQKTKTPKTPNSQKKRSDLWSPEVGGEGKVEEGGQKIQKYCYK